MDGVWHTTNVSFGGIELVSVFFMEPFQVLCHRIVIWSIVAIDGYDLIKLITKVNDKK